MNTSIHALQDSTVENGNTILLASLIVKGELERHHRIVLRWWSGEFVTHIETLKIERIRFSHGSERFFSEAYEFDCFVHDGYTEGQYLGKDLDKALTSFHKRAGRLLKNLTRKAQDGEVSR